MLNVPRGIIFIEETSQAVSFDKLRIISMFEIKVRTNKKGAYYFKYNKLFF